MTKIATNLILYLIIFSSCQSGKLENLTDLPYGLKEISALEYTASNRLLWIIEDAGNSNNLFALDEKGQLTNTIEILNSENDDWEDLTSDNLGNIYIGDFGNNSKERENFIIYKVSKPNANSNLIKAEKIEFELPKKMDSQDFEAFFLFNGTFYIFSKEDKKGTVISVKNISGKQDAKKVCDFNLDGKNDKITSADISEDGKTVILLNHEKLWKLTNFKGDNFFGGTIEKLEFGHDSQKEGIVFISDDQVLITDEQDGTTGGNLYRFKL